MKYASENLEKEHRLIERMLKVLKRIVEQLEQGGTVAIDYLFQSLDFMENYADVFHHKKEEDILFIFLKDNRIHHLDSLVKNILDEHVRARKFTRALEAAIPDWRDGDEVAKTRIVENIHCYLRLLSNHILREDDLLFRRMNRNLGEPDQLYLQQAYDRIDEKFGDAFHQKYFKLVEDLEKKDDFS